MPELESCIDGEGEVVTVIPAGTEIEAVTVENTADWLMVDVDGISGFIPSDSIEAIEEEEPVEEEPVEEEALFTVAAITDVPVRIAPDGMSEIFATLPEGTETDVYAVEGDWFKVKVDGETGYVYSGDVEDQSRKEEPEEPAPADQTVQTPKKVTIFTSRRTVMTPGEMITLTSRLEGFEDCTNIVYQWECDKGDGFEAVSGATGDTYEYPGTIETLTWSWRLKVYFN